MNKALKYTLIGAGGLVVLLAAAMALILALVNPNDYRDEIAQVVHDKTGRTLTFDGDLSLSVFPWIGLETGKLSLSNAAGFGDAPFAAIDRAKIKVRLLPLLSKKVDVGMLELDGLLLNLARNKQGKTNWDDLTSAGAAKKAAPEEPEATDARGSGSGAALAGLAVGGVDVKDAQVGWSDAQSGKSYRVHDLNAATGAIAFGKPFDFKLSVQLESAEPAVNASVDVSGEATVGLSEQRYEAKGVKVAVQAKGGAIPGGEISAALTADVSADLKAQTAAVEHLVLTAYNVKASGRLRATSILGKPAAKVDLKVDPFDAKKLLNSLGAAVETSDPKALGKVALQTTVDYEPASVSAKSIILTLDDTTATGMFSLSDFKAPAYRTEWKVDAVNVDRYLPPAKPEGAGSAAAASKTGAAQPKKAVGLPLEPLRKLDCDAVLEIGKLTVKKLNWSDVRVEVHAKNGVVAVKPVKLSGYGAALASALTLDARTDTPAAAVDVSVAGLNLGPMLKDMTGQQKAEGVVTLGANLQTRGQSQQAMVEHLNGKADFKMQRGKIMNFNPVRVLRNAVSLLKGGGTSGSVESDYADLTGSATIRQGVVYNNDLNVRSPLFRATGEGAVNLAGQTVDYVLNTSLVASTEGQGGADVDDLIDVTIPIGIRGSLADPSIGVDPAKLARIILKTGVRDVKGVVQGTGEALGEGLKVIGKELEGSRGSGSESKEGSGDKKKTLPADLIRGLFQ
ncbi:MAG: AsmA protein [Desulfovibrionales bacterium]|nr:AsmA protein [Desulfovibrionales bacterium]